jgi:hypothetical protein
MVATQYKYLIANSNHFNKDPLLAAHLASIQKRGTGSVSGSAAGQKLSLWQQCWASVRHN